MEEYIWPTSFVCTLIKDKIILPNQYGISISIEPVGPADLALGFRRLRTFVDYCLHNSIFIQDKHVQVESLKGLDTNVVHFPEEPYDFFVGAILFSKLRAITSNYFEIGFMTIDSSAGDHVQYCIRDPEEAGVDLSGEYWWNMDNLDTGTGNTVTWEALDLHDTSPKFEPRIITGGRSGNQ